MTLIVVKINEHNCRAIIATNFTHSFCGAGLVKVLQLNVTDLSDPPAVTTSDGTPIEFLGLAHAQLEVGPWRSNGFIPLLIAFDCPADVLIGQDLIDEISKTFPVKFEFYKNAVNIGGTRVSMLDPMASEEKFLSVRLVDPRSNEEIGLETWKKGVREGGLLRKRLEELGKSGSSTEAEDKPIVEGRTVEDDEKKTNIEKEEEEEDGGGRKNEAEEEDGGGGGGAEVKQEEDEKKLEEKVEEQQNKAKEEEEEEDLEEIECQEA